MPQDALLLRSNSLPPTPAQPDADYACLAVFIGAWHTEGQQLGGRVGPAGRIVAVETFEWLTGHRFVVHRFEGRVGEAEASCIELIGRDPVRGAFTAHTFYNTGVTSRWDYRNAGSTWHVSGDFEIAGESTPVRCTIELDGDAAMRSRWEHLHDGAWWTFWETASRKVK